VRLGKVLRRDKEIAIPLSLSKSDGVPERSRFLPLASKNLRFAYSLVLTKLMPFIRDVDAEAVLGTFLPSNSGQFQPQHSPVDFAFLPNRKLAVTPV
jgi:hypothetical protein